MTGQVTEIIILGAVVFAVLMGVLQLLMAIWEGRKPAASNNSQ